MKSIEVRDKKRGEFVSIKHRCYVKVVPLGWGSQ
ncbi:hypothetical protein SAMN04489761_0126 [Tenacibaculum sp. MAR_2009_124]|nr:hypothetical protein SAMN04489761_0126 [Tenacibaculum sp. MAR_2009_124]